jgi:hypothetical protein
MLDIRYRSLLGKIAFDVDMAKAGLSKEEADRKWEDLTSPPVSNVVYGTDFGKGRA